MSNYVSSAVEDSGEEFFGLTEFYDGSAFEDSDLSDDARFDDRLGTQTLDSGPLQTTQGQQGSPGPVNSSQVHLPQLNAARVDTSNINSDQINNDCLNSDRLTSKRVSPEQLSARNHVPQQADINGRTPVTRRSKGGKNGRLEQGQEAFGKASSKSGQNHRTRVNLGLSPVIREIRGVEDIEESARLFSLDFTNPRNIKNYCIRKIKTWKNLKETDLKTSQILSGLTNQLFKVEILRTRGSTPLNTAAASNLTGWANARSNDAPEPRKGTHPSEVEVKSKFTPMFARGVACTPVGSAFQQPVPSLPRICSEEDHEIIELINAKPHQADDAKSEKASELSDEDDLSHIVPQVVLFRVYGDTVADLYDSRYELQVFTCLAKHQSAPKLIASFPGGRIEEYILGPALKHEEMGNPWVTCAIASILGRFHQLGKSVPEIASWKTSKPATWKFLDKWGATAFALYRTSFSPQAPASTTSQRSSDSPPPPISLGSPIPSITSAGGRIFSAKASATSDASAEPVRPSEVCTELPASTGTAVIPAGTAGVIAAADNELPNSTEGLLAIGSAKRAKRKACESPRSGDVWIGDIRDCSSPGSTENFVWTKLRGYSAELRNDFIKSIEKTSFLEMYQESKLLEALISPSPKEMAETPVLEQAFCHNDVQENNILVTGTRLRLIDFEYADWNYPAFDIANFFCEMTIDYDQTYEGGFRHRVQCRDFPKEELIRLFGSVYLSQVLSRSVLPSSDHLKPFLRAIYKFVLASHLLWGIWSIIRAMQPKTASDFDFLGYAASRFKAYKLWKEAAKWNSPHLRSDHPTDANSSH